MRRVLTLCTEEDEKELIEEFKNKIILSGDSAEPQYYHFPSNGFGRKRKGYPDALKFANDNNIDSILCTKDYMDVAMKLLWQAKSVKRYFVSDCENAFEMEENDSRIQTMLWDNIAAKGKGNPISQTKWQNSFTGELLSQEEMDEYADDVVVKLSSYIKGDETVVEIGVASGITCFKVAPKVKRYYGVDISEETLKNTGEELQKRNIKNVSLARCEAINVDELQIDNANIFIINSVCQYFPGYNYFYAVIEKMISMLKNGGIIYLGDMLDSEKLEEFDRELQEHGGKRNQRDLWYPRDIIRETEALFPRIHNVEIDNKIGTIENELTRYRFDAILHVGKEDTSSMARSKYQYSMLDEDIKDKAKEYGDDSFLKYI